MSEIDQRSETAGALGNGETTVNRVFINRAGQYGSRLAVEKNHGGSWVKASWKDYYENARAVGLALRSLGLENGDRVALLSENRLEWLYTDMGVLGAGGCLVPIYATLTGEEIGFILRNSGARFAVLENSGQLEKVMAVRETCPELQLLIIIDTTGSAPGIPGVMAFSELLAAGRAEAARKPGDFERLAEAVTTGDLATIVYTSGTTGLPKGAMITHGNIMAVVKSLDEVRPRYGFETDQTLPFLPLCHVFERIAGHFYGMYVGLTSSYAEGIETIVRDIRDKRPTVILAVPRVCEKIYQGIMLQVSQSPPWKRKVFAWGQGVGREISRLRESRQAVPPLLKLKHRLAYALVFRKLKEALGGRVRWITASGAPTAREIIQFFNAAGITVIEGYGMTECTAPATMSNLADHRIGTVGRPLPGVDIQLAEDGEILVRGGNVFKGYWDMPEETAAAFTPEGFLMTGDIGRWTKDGFLEVVDRKKDLIITAGGKNVAPQKIENLFKKNPLFSQVIVVGERRKYLTALFNLNLQQAERLAKNKGIPHARPEELTDNSEFLRLVDDIVTGLNSHLARFETIKKYRVIPHEFSKETGELTATLKVKRRVVQEMYKEIIDSMYAD